MALSEVATTPSDRIEGVKASDIAETAFLEAMVKVDRGGGACWWILAEELKIPEKVVLAKARRLLRRGIISGCGCGCRGGWVLGETSPAAISSVT